MNCHTEEGGHSFNSGVVFPLHRLAMPPERDCTVCRGHCDTRTECLLPEATKPASNAVIGWVCFIGFAAACLVAAWVAPSFVPY